MEGGGEMVEGKEGQIYGDRWFTVTVGGEFTMQYTDHVSQ